MNLRDATPADLDAIRRLVFSIAAEYGFEPDPEGVDADLCADSEAYFEEGAMLRVLEHDGGVVGMIGVVPRPDRTWELRKIYLDPAFRGGGWGRRLVDEARAFARSQGARAWRLETSTKLGEALRLYERAGFAPVQGSTRSQTCDLSMELAL